MQEDKYHDRPHDHVPEKPTWETPPDQGVPDESPVFDIPAPNDAPPTRGDEGVLISPDPWENPWDKPETDGG
jgi:hypothetical protein